MRAIILAGGMGTRLRSRVSDLPKPMAPVAGRPFLEYLLKRLEMAGLTQVTLSVGYKWNAIRNHFGVRFGRLQIDYSVESEPLGTGGAILHALRADNESPMMVLNGDSLLDLNFGEFKKWCEAEPSSAALVVRAVEDISRYGGLTVEDGYVSAFSEKGLSGPGWINAGIYWLQPSVFNGYQPGERFSFEQDILQARCHALHPRVWCTDAYFIDIGIPEDFDRAQTELPLLDLKATKQ